MAEDQGKVTPALASQLVQSPLVQNEDIKAQLQQIAEPIIPMAAPENVPSALAPNPEVAPEQEFADQLTAVPTEVQPVPLDQKSPEQLTSSERELLIAQKLGERDAEQDRRLEAGEMNSEEELAYLKEEAGRKLANKQQEFLAPDVQIRLDGIQAGVADYLEAKNTFEERNRLRAESGRSLLTEEPNIINFVSAEDGQFGAEAGLEYPDELKAVFAQSVEQEKQNTDVDDKKKQVDDVVNSQTALAEAEVEKANKAKKEKEKVEEDMEKDVAAVRTQFTSLSDLFENASTGRRVGAAIAIMFGGISQGLTGASVNPVLDMLDKTFKNNFAAKQFAAEELDKAFKEKQALIPDPYEQLQMEEKRQTIIKWKLANKDKEASNRLKTVGKNQPIPQEMIDKLPAGDPERDLLVRVPGSDLVYRGGDPTSVKASNKNLVLLDPAIQTLDRLIAKIDSPDYNKWNFTADDRSAIAGELGAVIGALRIPVLGPGVMTESERSFMEGLIGNPNKLLTLNSWQKAKLRAVKGVLKRNIKAHLKIAGVVPPPTKAEGFNNENIAAAKLRNPKASRIEIVQGLQSTNKWHPE